MDTAASSAWLPATLNRARGARVGVFGDFRLDARWAVDPAADEDPPGPPKAGGGRPPIGVGGSPWRIRDQAYALAAAGHIAAALADLNVNAVHAVTVIGDDLFGWQLLELLRSHRVNTEGVLRGPAGWQTPVAAHPTDGPVAPGAPGPRCIDFGAFNRLDEPTAHRLADALDRAAVWCQVVVIHQHAPDGVVAAVLTERINQTIRRRPNCRFLVEAPHRPTDFDNVTLKLDAHEAARACGEDAAADEPIDGERARRFALELHRHQRQPVFIVHGGRSILVADRTGLHESPTAAPDDPADPRSAGRTITAALAAVLAGGGDPITAARLAGLAAAVTIRKPHAAGTATPEEIHALAGRSI